MGSTVLVIDDNPVNLKLAAEVLQADGHEVIRADDAEQALALLAAHLPDLVLTDIALPGMDGLELTRRLKSDPRYRHLPVVALTASAMKGDEQRVLDAGCDAYIAKPLDTRQLSAQVARILARGRPAADR
ncbi:MAG TPA: response regulator [Steroidobacteraceae bacterium]|nr:response regulator [Steroidobacteraceae bacterium]